MSDIDIITVCWNAERDEYKVSRPNWNGGEVVMWSDIKRTLARQGEEIERLTRVCEHWQRSYREACASGDIIVAECARLRAEVERLMRILGDPGTTHAEGCSTWGPKHWQCALNERDALLARVETAEKDAGRLRRGLDFYAQQSHFLFDDGWDTVSGEPQNFWCDEYGATVEDGTIAKLVLAGWDMPADDDGDMIPPTDAAMEGGK